MVDIQPISASMVKVRVDETVHLTLIVVPIVGSVFAYGPILFAIAGRNF